MKTHGDQLLAATPVPKAIFRLPHLWPDAVTGVYLAGTDCGYDRRLHHSAHVLSLLFQAKLKREDEA